jgi:uncharacterized OsmC-like protein
MTLTSELLKDAVREWYERLGSAKDPSDYIATPNAKAKLTGPQTCEASADGFTIRSDEPKWIDGTDTAPHPTTLFLASIGFAEDMVFARQAALNGVDFDSYETTVSGKWNLKGMFGLGDADPAFEEIAIETRVETGAESAKIAELLRLTHMRCPLTATIRKATRITRKLVVNDVEVPIRTWS